MNGTVAWTPPGSTSCRWVLAAAWKGGHAGASGRLPSRARLASSHCTYLQRPHPFDVLQGHGRLLPPAGRMYFGRAGDSSEEEEESAAGEFEGALPPPPLPPPGFAAVPFDYGGGGGGDDHGGREYAAVGFSYREQGAEEEEGQEQEAAAAAGAAEQRQQQAQQQQQEEEPFVAPFFVPERLRRHLPPTQRQYKARAAALCWPCAPGLWGFPLLPLQRGSPMRCPALPLHEMPQIIRQTAGFVRGGGQQLEVLLRVKQARGGQRRQHGWKGTHHLRGTC